MNQLPFQKHQTAQGNTIAYQQCPGNEPGVIYLGGLRSNMNGTKALYIQHLCKRLNLNFIRFDYYGHGRSSGSFETGSLSQWLADSLLILDQFSQGPQILVGSSMGAWLMVLMALQRLTRIKALIGIAAAPDFTDDFALLTEAQQYSLKTDGFLDLPSSEGEAYRLSQAFIDDSLQHRILCKTLPINCPVRLLHGTADDSVSWQQSFKLAQQLESLDVQLTLLKDADHRLSKPNQLACLSAILIGLIHSNDSNDHAEG